MVRYAGYRRERLKEQLLLFPPPSDGHIEGNQTLREPRKSKGQMWNERNASHSTGQHGVFIYVNPSLCGNLMIYPEPLPTSQKCARFKDPRRIAWALGISVELGCESPSDDSYPSHMSIVKKLFQDGIAAFFLINVSFNVKLAVHQFTRACVKPSTVF